MEAKCAEYSATWAGPAGCCGSAEMLPYCCMNNANRSHVSLRSTFSNCHFLFDKKADRVEVNISPAFLHWVGIALHP